MRGVCQEFLRFGADVPTEVVQMFRDGDVVDRLVVGGVKALLHQLLIETPVHLGHENGVRVLLTHSLDCVRPKLRLGHVPAGLLQNVAPTLRMNSVDEEHCHVDTETIAHGCNVNEHVGHRLAKVGVEVVELCRVRPGTAVGILAMCCSVLHKLARVEVVARLRLLYEVFLVLARFHPLGIHGHVVWYEIEHELHPHVCQPLAERFERRVATKRLVHCVLHDCIWRSNDILVRKTGKHPLVRSDPARLRSVELQAEIAEAPNTL
mmetsp:Transcript_6866/g.20880  ORF Transcript_6866/g.20880 Transcript_6866/m.20880 type:complete len:264 (+) Transcript_6866:601-1392(+)